MANPANTLTSHCGSSKIHPSILGPEYQQQPNSPLATCENPSPKHRQPSTTAVASPSTGSASVKHPGFRGIRYQNRKWVTEIREPGTKARIWLGTHQTAEMAAAAYDVATLALHGPNVVLNFPDSVPSYPVPASSASWDIRAAAAAAAAARLPKPMARKRLERSGPENEESGRVDTTAFVEDFMVEEAFFDMPNMLVAMAEGMMLSPPRMKAPPPSDHDSGEYSDGEESDLWS